MQGGVGLIIVYGKVYGLLCRDCGRASRTIIFSGHSADGTVALSSIVEPEIVVAQAEHDEYWAGEPETGRRVLKRVSAALGRSDLRFAPFRRAETRDGWISGGTAIFECPLCGGEAAEAGQQTFEHFRRAGGVITTHGSVQIGS